MLKLNVCRFGLAVTTAILVAAPSFRAESPASNSELPPGPMLSKAETACLECHEARIIVQQRLSKAAWTKEVDKMTRWGAVVDPADHDPLIDYFSSNFPPDRPPYEAGRTAATPKK